MNDEFPEDQKSGDAERERLGERLGERLRVVEAKLEDTQAESGRLRETVSDLAAKVGRLDARLRRIHRRWGFRLLNSIFGYDKLDGE